MKTLKFLLAGTALLGLVGLGVLFSQPQAIVTDLNQVLPAQASVAQQRLTDMAGNKVLVAIWSQDTQRLEQTVEDFLHRVEQFSPAGSWTLDRQGEDNLLGLAGTLATLPGKYQLLSAIDRKALRDGDFSGLDQGLKTSLFGLPTDLRWQPFAQDPYNLVGRLLAGLVPKLVSSMEFNGDYFTGRVEGREVALLPLAGADVAHNFDQITRSKADFDSLIKEFNQHQDTLVIPAGALFHIAQAAGGARQEIAIFSALSVLGILLLFLVTFGNGRALFFTACSILFGGLLATGVSGLIFGQLHAIALVFGCSLIGVGVDYAFHYVCLGESAKYSQLRRTSLLAMLSTGSAYLCLMQSDIQVVTQVAVLSSVGLAAAWLFVVVLFPVFFSSAVPVRNRWIRQLAHWVGDGHPLRKPWQVIVVVCLFGVVGVAFLLQELSYNKSVNSLYQTNPELVGNDLRVSKLLNGFSPIRYFLVEANSVDGVLSQMQTLKPLLEQLQTEGQIQGYQLFSELFSSEKGRTNNQRLVDGLYGRNGHIYDQVTLSPEVVANLQAAVEQSADIGIAPEEIDAIGRKFFPHLWFGRQTNLFSAMVPLISPAQNLASAVNAGVEISGVRYVDQPQLWGDALILETRQAIQYFALVAVLVGILLFVAFRSLRGLTIVLMPALSGLLVLVMLTLMGQAISVFHVFGLYLIVGLGIDYGVFIFRNEDESLGCYVAVLLSALTTALAFGILSQSTTPMIASFGLTVLCGTILNLILMPGIRIFRGL